MKPLKASDKQQQERWEYNGRKYSIVDLTTAPLERNGLRASDLPGSRFSEVMLSAHGRHHFEVADVTDGIDVIGRYASFEAARAAIERGFLDETEAA